MIHPIPADSWRNLIEQIGGCPGAAGLQWGNVGSWGAQGPPAWKVLLHCWSKRI